MSTYQRFQDLQLALKEWIRSGRQGTAPRKVRANSSETSELSRQARVKRDRKKERITKLIQRQRRAKGQNVISGKARAR